MTPITGVTTSDFDFSDLARVMYQSHPLESLTNMDEDEDLEVEVLTGQMQGSMAISSETQEAVPKKMSRTQRKNAERKQALRARRLLEGNSSGSFALAAQIVNEGETNSTSVTLMKLPHASTSYLGQLVRPALSAKPIGRLASSANPTGRPAKRPSRLEESDDEESSEFENEAEHCPRANCHPEVHRLISEGWRYIKNDISRAQFFTDSKGLVFAAKARQPKGWSRTLPVLERAVNDLAAALNLGPEAVRIVRGEFKSTTFGISFGNGQTTPGELKQRATHKEAELTFSSNPAVQSLMKHVKQCFQTFFPRHAEYYQNYERELLEISGLKKRFMPGSPFLSTTVNLSEQSWSPLHWDSMNLAFGLCCIVALGDFDYEAEGHNLMEPAKSIFEFRRGDVMFLPSGTVRHGNIPVTTGKRQAIVLYSAGGLFRWVDQGHQTLHNATSNKFDVNQDVKSFTLKLNDGSPTELTPGEKRWYKGLELFMTHDELKAAQKLGIRPGKKAKIA